MILQQKNHLEQNLSNSVVFWL